MGAIAEGIVAYAQPLLDGTDGSEDQLNRAMTIAQLCWNLALLPEGQQAPAIDKMKPALKMTDEEFAEFRQKIILPMIRRHCEMFPGIHRRGKGPSASDDFTALPAENRPRTGRNDPCPCGSGRKYKLCCARHA